MTTTKRHIRIPYYQSSDIPRCHSITNGYLKQLFEGFDIALTAIFDEYFEECLSTTYLDRLDGIGNTVDTYYVSFWDESKNPIYTSLDISLHPVFLLAVITPSLPETSCILKGDNLHVLNRRIMNNILRDYEVSILVLKQNFSIVIEHLFSYGCVVFVSSLVIVRCKDRLDLSKSINSVKELNHLVLISTKINVPNFVFPTHLHQTMKVLLLVDCYLTEVPEALASLIRLTLLDISCNDIRDLPVTLGKLRELETFLYQNCPLEFPPENVLTRPAQDVIRYLQTFRKHRTELVPHNEAKLIVAGEEGVGKSTLIKGLQRNYWFNDVTPPDKTDGVDINMVSMRGTQFRVYDLAGDVEYLNTHPLFLSPQCIHLVVFDMSQFLPGKGTRSDDQLCRLEMWLKTIAAQQPKSYAIIVGTHVDHPRITKDITRSVRSQIAALMRKYQQGHNEYFDKCMLCNTELLPTEFQEIDAEKSPLPSDLQGINGAQLPLPTELQEVEGAKSAATIQLDKDLATASRITHILGYFEVSSVTKYPPAMMSLTNRNLESLKSAIASSNLLTSNKECGVPKSWLLFQENVTKMDIRPTALLSLLSKVAVESNIPSDEMESVLRYFHSRGSFLWYEDIPEMKEVIITDPSWLSDKLRTLISYRPSVNAVCDGILDITSLSEVWPDMTEDKQQELLALFRGVGLCFSMSDDKELFPCNLPIGWPDRQKWPPLPSKDECQTNLLFTFSFLPPTFPPRLIVEINKRQALFPSNVEPLYFRFHILYVTKENSECEIHSDLEEDGISNNSYHKIHYEIMPHYNAIKVSVRGPNPCCPVPGVCSTIKDIQSYFPGISFQTKLICPICEMHKDAKASSFALESSKQEHLCSRCWKNVGSIDDILRGNYSPPSCEDTRKAVGETLEDYHCPKLFLVLPINTECSSLKDRIVYSYLKDGYAVHLLCECPDQWHFVDSPGFRIGKPKQFLEKYGKHLCTVLRAIGKLGTPLRLAASAEPLCKTGAAVASGATSVAKELEGFLENALDKYPELKSASYKNIGDLKRTSSGLERSELGKFLETVAKGREFGPLIFTYVDKYRDWFWLCDEHNKRFSIIDI